MKFEELIGETLVEIIGEVGGGRITFKTQKGKDYILYHPQDCCEIVQVEDINGDLSDLIGTPLTMAGENSNSESLKPDMEAYSSFTWTFYKLATIKGFVDIRWFGLSNGCYSERVDFCELGKESY